MKGKLSGDKLMNEVRMQLQQQFTEKCELMNVNNPSFDPEQIDKLASPFDTSPKVFKGGLRVFEAFCGLGQMIHSLNDLEVGEAVGVAVGAGVVTAGPPRCSCT